MQPPRAFHRHTMIRNVIARPRLFICAAIGLLILAAMPPAWHFTTRLLIAWNVGAVIYIAASLVMMARSTAHTIRQTAILTDEGRFVVLILACLAATASFAAIFMQLAVVKDAHGLLRAGHLALAAVTVVSAWTFTHIMFAQHYAHEFFIERVSEKDLAEEYRGGLRFPGGQKPDFFDFLYFSFIIGVASQTADIEISSRPMRRVSLVHSLLSFVFNTIIVALTINIASGLVGS